MTDPMELVGRLEKRIAYDKKHYPPVDPLFTQAAACIREMVEKIKIMDEQIDLLNSELCDAYTD